MRRAPALLLAVLALVTAGIWIALPDEAPSEPPPMPELARAAVELEPATSPMSLAEPRGRSLARAPSADARSTLGVEMDSATEDPADPVLLRVVEGPSNAPMVDAEVALQTPGHPTVYAITDEHGAFEFSASEIPAVFGDEVQVVVKDEDGHARLRNGVTLARDFLLHVQAKAVLQGEIALASGESPEWLCVSMWSPARGSEKGETFVGYQNLGRDGRFAIPSLGMTPPDYVRIEVAKTGLPVSLSMPTTEMLVSPGPRIVVALVLLQLAVVDEIGDPIPQALVRCTVASAAISTDRAAFDGNLSAEPSTGLDGRTRLWVPAGTVTVVSGAPGYTTVQRVVRAEAEPLEIVLPLRKLTDADRLTGSVVFEDGTAAPGIEIEAWNDDESGLRRRVSSTKTVTDAEGGFALAIDPSADVGIRALDRESEQAEAARWRSSDPAVRLVIDRGQTLLVRADAESGAHSPPTERIEVTLLGERGTVRSIQTDALPLKFAHVPAGRWDVYALDRNRARWAHGEAFMTRAGPEEVTLGFERFGFIEGVMQPPPKIGLHWSVAFTPNGWPAGIVEVLLSVDVAPDGTFRVPAPGAGEIVLREGYRNVDRRPAVGGGAPIVFLVTD